MKDKIVNKGRPDSQLVNLMDSGDMFIEPGATERKYKMNNFDPAKEVKNLSYTSGRVARRVYNEYEPNKYKVVGYYTDWAQFDGRYDGEYADDKCGRGIDLMKLNPKAYDKLIIGFAGIVGDKGEKQQVIEQAAKDFDRKTDEVTFVDAWGDVGSYINCGFRKKSPFTYQELFDEASAQGMLGGLRKLKLRNPDLILSLSVGGWNMSEAFYSVVRDASRRATFINSLADIFTRFPMLTEVDIDWEYPGMPGNGNPFEPDDAKYYQLLIRELKQKLPDVKVSIAAGASLQALALADIPGMIEAGVEGINLMTYDFFSSGAPKLAHHTNLRTLDVQDEDSYSIDKSVDFLLGAGVEPQNILIGYAGYSRNARNVEMSSFSPLQGTYNAGSGTTTGSFESGVSEWYDVLYNYLDLENQTGLNGFNVYTDLQANADYLYNPDTKLFISYDSPRAVREKGQYVQRKKLGGMLARTIDHDNGVLVNAAREGLGNTVRERVVDMEPFYFYGINVEGLPPKAVITAPQQVSTGQQVIFSALKSQGTDLTYLWKAPGLDFLDNKTDSVVTGVAPDTDGDFTVSLVLTDYQERSDSVSQSFKVRKPSPNKPTAQAILELKSGTPFTLSASHSTEPQNQPLTYLWVAEDLPFDGSKQEKIDATAPTVAETTDYSIVLTVSNETDSDEASLSLHVIPAVEDAVAGATETVKREPGS